MKFIYISFFILLISSLQGFSQPVEPVHWEFKTIKIDSQTFDLQMTAKIDKPWHLYGQYFEDGGPVKLKFIFEKNDQFELVGKTIENLKPKTVRDEIFEIDVQYFAEKAVFTQRVKLSDTSPIKLNIEGQVCNDNSGMCIMVFGENVFTFK